MLRCRRTQTDTYLAWSILAEAAGTMLDNFVPDYLLERVEVELSHRIINGYYPRLGLAPGQRFASKAPISYVFPSRLAPVSCRRAIGSFPSIFNVLGIEVRVMVRKPFAPLTSPDRSGRDDPGAWVRAHSSVTCDRLRRWEGR